MSNATAILQDLAKRFKGKLSSCRVYDANVCTTRSVPGRPWELELVSGEPLTEQLKLTHRERKVSVLANNAYIHGSAAGTFAGRPFTVNAKQRVVFRSEFADTLSVGAARYPVFTEDGKVSSEQRNLLGRPELLSLVAQVGLQEGESLYFTRGEIGFYLKPTGDSDRVGGLIAQVVELAEKVGTIEEGPKLELLPVQFHPLIPMIKKWAVTDDSERNDLLDTTPRPVLRSLVDEVSPYLEAISSFLDSFGQKAPTEEAASLGRLAECVVEAKQLLDGAQAT
ncbi:MAG TPA: hypothetical protein VMU80_16960 [Bryobacteraceae bacterium]|nr:hypothetical protein [Bryobacteraceae bacterium]HUO30918.1 hypothetical protein [Bryobacteraceae bacterium]